MQRSAPPWTSRCDRLVIRDEGRSYDIAFMEDPLNIVTQTAGDGILARKVRKRDSKIVNGTTFIADAAKRRQRSRLRNTGLDG